MLKITIPSAELFDNRTQEFIQISGATIALEHSLVSISKWEAKWKKPFLSETKKTDEEMRDYIKCMTLTQNVDPTVYYGLTKENMQAISKYIEDPMTATWFNENDIKKGRPKGPRNSEQPTSELIYYWMVAYQIPWECQKWHINRLMTLIKICSVKQEQPKKMSKKDIYARNAAINAARRKKYGTKG